MDRRLGRLVSVGGHIRLKGEGGGHILILFLLSPPAFTLQSFYGTVRAQAVSLMSPHDGMNHFPHRWFRSFGAWKRACKVRDRRIALQRQPVMQPCQPLLCIARQLGPFCLASCCDVTMS